MADPVVGITNGVPTSGTGTITTLGQTLLDGANATLGVTTGAAVTTSAAGTIQQYLRGIVSLLVSGITVASHAVTNAGTFAVQVTSNVSTAVTNAGTFAVQATLTAGSLILGKVGIDQTTDGTTNKVAADLRVAGSAIATGSGANGSTVPRFALATDSPGVIAAAVPGTPNTTQVMTVQGAASMTPVLVTPGVSATANGATPSRINSAASNNLTNLKASAGQLYSIDVFNVAAYNVFLKLYNKASAPVVASDTPIMTIPIQAGGGYSKTWPMGKPFSTGIAYAIVKLQADTDNTNVVAGDLTGSIDWI